MKHELRLSKDGSHTFYLPEINEHYHSSFGAITESETVFIRNGLKHVRKSEIKILEIGFGTGLNALLSLVEASNKKQQIFYTGIDTRFFGIEEIKQLNYPALLYVPEDLFLNLHRAETGEETRINKYFCIDKKLQDIRTFTTGEKFDLVYFDAFAPDKVPELWNEEVFVRLADCMTKNSVLCTYSSKGSVKRALRSAGFSVQRLAGPPGKRHVLRAVKV